MSERLQVGIDFSQKRSNFCLLFRNRQPLELHQACHLILHQENVRRNDTVALFAPLFDTLFTRAIKAVDD